MSLPRPVKAVVFDMDGLLVDTETVVYAAMQRAAAGIGGEMPFATFQRMVGLQHAHSDLILIEHFGEGFDLDAWARVVSEHFQEEAAVLGIPLSATLAVGDGANDLAMIEASGLGVAYRAKPIVAAQAHAKVDHADLTALLYFQGYAASEFVVD